METKIKTKSGELIFSDEKVAISFGTSEHHVVTVSELRRLLNRCYKAPKKDWEIVSVFTDFHKVDVKDGRVGSGYGGGIYTTAENAINELGYKIHSVRRLSDSEVFTVGDNTTKGIIHSFEILDGILSVSVGDQKTLLRTFEKSKQPLFVTEDGVDVFANDSCFEVTEYFRIYQSSYYENANPNHTSKYFSTREKAEEYILLNKPCFSANEILKYLDDRCGSSESIDIIELAKQKHITHAN